MDKKNTEQNDWDNEEDEWDDWGDAEEELENDPEAKQFNEAKSKEASKSNIEQVKEQVAPTFEKHEEKEKSQASWASMFKPFGGVVSTITSSVSQGINQVIGVPDPEEMARINAAEAEKLKEAKSKETNNSNIEELKEQTTPTAPIFGLDLVSGVTTFGSKVLNTGLDTLEGIGKKTMTILQENDPLLMNKRKMLGLDTEKPNLSAVLQEAKKDADQLEHTLQQLRIEKSKTALCFESLFENNCGLVHLEALEILSKESTLKLQKLFDSISGQALVELQETVAEVKELIELEDLEGESEGNYETDDLHKLLDSAVEDADLKISFDDIVKIWSETLVWFEENSSRENLPSAEELFKKGTIVQAETCALEINKLHKIAELLLVKEHHSTANEVDAIVQICKQFSIHLHGLTSRFATALTSPEYSEDGKSLANTLFSEMILATQQINKAFHLFLPILQIGAV